MIEEEPFNDKSIMYRYTCKDCGLEHFVEDIVVDAFLASGKYNEKEMPKLGCPCGGTLIYSEDM